MYRVLSGESDVRGERAVAEQKILFGASIEYLTSASVTQNRYKSPVQVKKSLPRLHTTAQKVLGG